MGKKFKKYKRKNAKRKKEKMYICFLQEARFSCLRTFKRRVSYCIK